MKNLPATWKTWVLFLDWEDPLEKGMATPPIFSGFLVAQLVKKLPAMRETWVLSLGREDSLGEGNGYPLQSSCLENPMDRGSSPWGCEESDTTQ